MLDWRSGSVAARSSESDTESRTMGASAVDHPVSLCARLTQITRAHRKHAILQNNCVMRARISSERVSFIRPGFGETGVV